MNGWWQQQLRVPSVKDIYLLIDKHNWDGSTCKGSLSDRVESHTLSMSCRYFVQTIWICSRMINRTLPIGLESVSYSRPHSCIINRPITMSKILLAPLYFWHVTHPMGSVNTLYTTKHFTCGEHLKIIKRINFKIDVSIIQKSLLDFVCLLKCKIVNSLHDFYYLLLSSVF